MTTFSDYLGVVVLSLISSGIVGTIVASIIQRKKNKAEVSSIDTDTSAKQVATAMLLVDKYKTEYEDLMRQNQELEKTVEFIKAQITKITDEFTLSMDELREENVRLKNDNVDLRERVKRLEAQVVSLGGSPVTMQKRANDKK